MNDKSEQAMNKLYPITKEERTYRVIDGDKEASSVFVIGGDSGYEASSHDDARKITELLFKLDYLLTEVFNLEDTLSDINENTLDFEYWGLGEDSIKRVKTIHDMTKKFYKK